MKTFTMMIKGQALKTAVDSLMARDTAMDPERLLRLHLVSDNLVADESYVVSLNDLASLTSVEEKVPSNAELIQSFVGSMTSMMTPPSRDAEAAKTAAQAVLDASKAAQSVLDSAIACTAAAKAAHAETLAALKAGT